MKRRAFLKFLGLAPVAAALPPMALPRPEKPTEVRSAGYFMDVEAGEYTARIGATITVPMDDDAPLYGPIKHGDDFDAWWNRVKS